MSLGEYLGAGNGVTKGLYHLNGNSNDSSGNGYNGTPVNISYVNGRFGQCASFNGSNGYIGLPSNTISNMTQGTICVFVNRVNVGTNHCILDKKDPGIANYFLLRIFGTTNKIGLILNNLAEIYSNGTIQQNQRYFITITFTGSVVKFYINGVLDNTISYLGIVPNNAIAVDMGRERNSTGYFNGKIDELIIENRVWTPEEIKKYYTYTKGMFGML